MFELAWRGGATAARLHARRPGIDELPWGTLDHRAMGPRETLDARVIWSNGVFTEYASAAAFSALTGALLECNAPVDLVAASADIVVDELFHVELAARLVAELGGGTPIEFDVAAIAPRPTPGLRPVARAAEIAVTTSCVGEALSLPALLYSRATAEQPLVSAVVERLLTDEGPHARLGHWFLEWAAGDLTDAERAGLARVAVDAIRAYRSLWRDEPAGDAFADGLRTAVERGIVAPLARHGIALDAAAVRNLLDPHVA